MAIDPQRCDQLFGAEFLVMVLRFRLPKTWLNPARFP
jgi:hypothetical protein